MFPATKPVPALTITKLRKALVTIEQFIKKVGPTATPAYRKQMLTLIEMIATEALEETAAAAAA